MSEVIVQALLDQIAILEEKLVVKTDEVNDVAARFISHVEKIHAGLVDLVRIINRYGHHDATCDQSRNGIDGDCPCGWRNTRESIAAVDLTLHGPN